MKSTQIRLLNRILLLIGVTILLSLFVSCNSENDQDQTINLNFGFTFNNENFTLNKPYTDEHGEFIIDKLKFYISNVTVSDERGKLIHIADSYYLIDFQNETIGIPVNLPVGAYKTISFLMGLDEDANSTINHVGDLDPTNDMAWDWNVGYKFLVLEGLYYPNDSKETIGLVYHIGFTENARPLVFPIDNQQAVGFQVDVSSLFNFPNKIDLYSISNVQHNKEQAKLLADNYASGFITLQE